MKYALFDIKEPVTEQMVSALLQTLREQGADWRCEQALRFKHLFGQFCCLKSYELLMALSGYNASFAYNEHGKPFWPQGPFFSISHCKTGILVAVHDAPVGVDIESYRAFDESLVARTMNTEEQASIAAASDPRKAFISLWTQKEAYLKFIGTGIVYDLHQVLDNLPPTQKIVTEMKDLYAYTIVS